MSRIPKAGEKWRRKPAGYGCEIQVVSDTRARVKDIHNGGRVFWVSFDTLWREWEPLSKEVKP